MSVGKHHKEVISKGTGRPFDYDTLEVIDMNDESINKVVYSHWKVKQQQQ